MFRLWAKIYRNGKICKDMVIENQEMDTRTHKVFGALEQICYHLDLGNPIWLEKTVRDFQKHARTRFSQDNFVEQIDFDYLEISMLEEDEDS